MSNWCGDTLKPHMQHVSDKKTAEFFEYDFLDRVYHDFYNIMDTYETLELSAVLLSENGPNSKGVSEETYYSYVINTYLQNMHILNERLKAKCLCDKN